MRFLHSLVALGLLAGFCVGGDSAAQTVSDGDLSVQSVGAATCPDGESIRQGQQVRLQGTGFSAGASVTLQFSSEPFSAALGTTTADGTGAINVVVTVPQGFATPTFALFEANGPAPSGSRPLDRLIRVGPSATTDGDSDGVPDFCDNCVSVGNATQADGDSDGKGDACDSCPTDSANDPDGDGLCSNADSCPFDQNNDVDGDGVCGDIDNCPSLSNDQVDLDMNGIGDACQTNSTCSDGVDNDGDGFIDFPQDIGCAFASDTTETNSSFPCDDGLDNDGDAKIDFRSDGAGDPGCGSSASPAEDPECDDESDNDDDGSVDWDGDHSRFTADPECPLGYHNSEVIPEPSVQLGLGSGIALLLYLRRRNQTREARTMMKSEG